MGAFKTASTTRVNDIRSTPARNCGNATITNTSFVTICRSVAFVGTSPAIPRGGRRSHVPARGAERESSMASRAAVPVRKPRKVSTTERRGP
jgi:hypothetical protein